MQSLPTFLLKNWVILLIVFVGVFFRLFHIGSVPPSPSVDEVSTGYNAFSILKTGRDEYGEKFPLILRSYDDYQPALYAYLIIPFVWLLGLSVESIRIPSVILSVITLIATYFLVRELFYKNKNSEFIARSSVLFLAISPWHIYLSRLGFPANPGLSFLVLGILSFLKKKYVVSLPFVALSFTSYHSEKVILPFIVLFLILFHRKEILKFKKQFLIGCVIAVAIGVPFLKASLAPDALKRLEATNIKNSYDLKFLEEKEKYVIARNSNNVMGRIVHSEKIVTLSIVIDNYRKHFYPEWLFTNKSNRAMHKIPSFGLAHIFEAFLIVFGLLSLFRMKLEWRSKGLILIGIISAPFAASITSEAPHAVRAYTFLPWLHIISALGFVWLVDKIKSQNIKKFFIGIAILVILLFSLKMYKNYFVIFPSTQSSSFYLPQYNAIQYVLNERNKYQEVVVDVKDHLYQSYMYYLYVSQYDPKTYLFKGGTTSGGYEQEHVIGNITFRPIGKEEVLSDNNLYIINKKSYIGGNVIKEFGDLKGNIVIEAIVK